MFWNRRRCSDRNEMRENLGIDDEVGFLGSGPDLRVAVEEMETTYLWCTTEEDLVD